MPYLYCCKLIGKYQKKDVYKFGKTNQKDPNKRFQSYSGLNRIEKVIVLTHVVNADLLETIMLEELKKKYSFITDLGKEYFFCDDEKNLHQFIKELEIKYYNYTEIEEESNEIDEEIHEEQIAERVIKKRRIPIGFEINNISYKLPLKSSWRDLMLQVLKKTLCILDIELQEFENMLEENIKGGGGRLYFSRNETELRNAVKLFKNGFLYIEMNHSRTRIVKILNSIMLLFELDFNYFDEEK